MKLKGNGRYIKIKFLIRTEKYSIVRRVKFRKVQGAC